MLNILFKLLLVYLGLLTFLYFYQRNLLYFPDTNRPDPVAFGVLGGMETVNVKTEKGEEILGWYFPPTGELKPTIIFFHGNAGHIGHRIFKIKGLVESGYGVLLAEYLGYGGNLGKPSEESFYRGARAFMGWLTEHREPDLGKIIIYGESIGTGVAVQIASEFSVAGLVLESPFSSMVDLAQLKYPIVPAALLLKDKYKSADKIAALNMPMLQIHGEKDRTIPIKLSRRLFENAQEPKTFVEIKDAGHNDLYNYGTQLHILSFLSTITLRKENP